MADQVAPGDYDQLHHFVAVSPWDEAPLESELLAWANRLVGGPDAILVIDNTALPKKGIRSVGVGPQCAWVAGKKVNCQSLVSLTLAKDEVPIPIVLRLFLPDTWIKDAERLHHAGVPETFWVERSKPAIALGELQRVVQTGVSFGAVVTDAGYGISAPLRQALTALLSVQPLDITSWLLNAEHEWVMFADTKGCALLDRSREYSLYFRLWTPHRLE